MFYLLVFINLFNLFTLLFDFIRLPFEFCSGLLQCLGFRNGYIRDFKYRLIVIVTEKNWKNLHTLN